MNKKEVKEAVLKSYPLGKVENVEFFENENVSFDLILEDEKGNFHKHDFYIKISDLKTKV